MNLKKIFIIIFSIIIIFALGIYGGYSLFKDSYENNISSEDKKENEEKSDKETHTSVDVKKIDNVLDNPVQDSVQLTLNKEKMNENLYKFLYHLEEAYKKMGRDFNTYIMSHSKILNDSEERLYFAFSYATTLDNVSIVKNINANGLSEVGSYGVSKNDLLNVYKNIFNEEFNRTYNLVLKDNMVYGSLSTSHSDSGTILKANSLVRKGDIIILNIDYLSMNITDTNYVEMGKYSTIDYDSSYVKYKISMNLEKIDDNYIIKEIKVTK